MIQIVQQFLPKLMIQNSFFFFEILNLHLVY